MYIWYTPNDHTFLQIHISSLWVHVLMGFFVSPPWATWLAIMKSPPPQIKTTYLMLFYTYIILHDHIKSYIFMCFTLALYHMVCKTI
jgi:hypothetical protein